MLQLGRSALVISSDRPWQRLHTYSENGPWLERGDSALEDAENEHEAVEYSAMVSAGREMAQGICEGLQCSARTDSQRL